jgi:hypothetical protein
MVPPRLSRPILAENQRLTLLQRAFELHRRLVEALYDSDGDVKLVDFMGFHWI